MITIGVHMSQPTKTWSQTPQSLRTGPVKQQGSGQTWLGLSYRLRNTGLQYLLQLCRACSPLQITGAACTKIHNKHLLQNETISSDCMAIPTGSTRTGHAMMCMKLCS
mmetsp:Transcript_17308/g.37347  ORF Transcript_17308/g.37347 Transcript_17308/m.37347 type:complete len:108 (+) Transcript_17308:314-637(+)